MALEKRLRLGSLARQKIHDQLKDLRLFVARAILRNHGHILALRSDMHFAQHLCELCDEYALRVLMRSLGTRYGSSLYSPDKAGWLSSCGEYPFHSDCD